MKPNDNLKQQFRKNVIDEMVFKGIIPPKADSEDEKKLYEQWQLGKRKIKQKIMNEFITHSEEELRIINEENYRNKIADSLDLTKDDNVNFINLDGYTKGERRFLVGFINEEDRDRAGLIKLAEKPDLIDQLESESKATELFNQMKLPSVSVIKPFTKSEDGHALVCFEALNAKDGICMATKELVAAGSSELGKRGAELMLTLVGKKVPKEIDTSSIKRNERLDVRCRSESDFWNTWEAQKEVILSHDFGKLNTDYLAEDEKIIDKEKLHKLINDSELHLKDIIPPAEIIDGEYLIHGDTAPSNAFYSNTKDEKNIDRFLDLEHCGATKNLVLAFLTDVGNYGARLWPNAKMRSEYFNTILRQSKPIEREYNYRLLRSTIVFCSVYLAQFGMEPDHPEHDMSVKLLGQVETMIQSLEKQYASID